MENRFLKVLVITIGPFVVLALLFGLMQFAFWLMSNNTFTVRDPGGIVRSAELQLCGKVVALKRANEGFQGSFRVACEGSGSIKVVTNDEKDLMCVIGYVTDGISSNWVYAINDRECELLSVG